MTTKHYGMQRVLYSMLNLMPFVGWLLSLSTSSSPILASLKSDCSFQMLLMCVRVWNSHSWYSLTTVAQEKARQVATWELECSMFLISTNHFTHTLLNPVSYICLSYSTSLPLMAHISIFIQFK